MDSYHIVGEGVEERQEFNERSETARRFTNTRIGLAMKNLGFSGIRKTSGVVYRVKSGEVEKLVLTLNLGYKGIDGTLVMWEE
jgi:hypothetical protein